MLSTNGHSINVFIQYGTMKQYCTIYKQFNFNLQACIYVYYNDFIRKHFCSYESLSCNQLISYYINMKTV